VNPCQAEAGEVAESIEADRRAGLAAALAAGEYRRAKGVAVGEEVRIYIYIYIYM